jgi:hypothetical protein
MAAANDALNLDAVNLLEVQQTNAQHTVVANDVLNQDAVNLPKAKQTNA